MHNLTRQMIIDKVDCPICSAKAGQRCFQKGGRKFKSSVHHQRMQLAQNAFGFGKRRKPASPRTKERQTSFYSSWEWKAARYEALKTYGRRCQCCGWRPGDTEHGHLVVDHIKPRSKYPDLSLSVSNLQVMCNDCNMGKSNIWDDDFRDVEDWFSNIMRE